MRWSSARIAWSVVVGLALFLLLLGALSATVHLVPDRRSLGVAQWYLVAVGRGLIPHLPAAAVFLVLAIGLATGLLPGGSWPDLHERGAARQRAMRAFGSVFMIAVLFGLVLATMPRQRPGIDLRPPMVAAFDVAVVTGAVLMWVALGAHRGAAIGTLVLFAGGMLVLANWFPWWKRFDFRTLVGPWLLAHSIFLVLLTAAPIAFLMFLTAELRLAPVIRFTPGLAVVLVSGMFVLCGYWCTFGSYLRIFKMSQTVSGDR